MPENGSISNRRLSRSPKSSRFFSRQTTRIPAFLSSSSRKRLFPATSRKRSKFCAKRVRRYFFPPIFPSSWRISAGISTLLVAACWRRFCGRRSQVAIPAVISQRRRIGFRGDIGSTGRFGERSRGTERGGKHGEWRVGLRGCFGFPRG